MSGLHLLRPDWLWALPACLLPLLGHGLRRVSFPGLQDWPADRVSAAMRWGLRLLMGLLLASLVLAAAGPYLEGGHATSFGEGAEIVVVLDRSGSMTEPLAGQERGSANGVSKIAAARGALLEFMRQRPADTFGVVAFNSSAIPVAPLSPDRELARAAMSSAEAKSVGFTAVSRALGTGLQYFVGRPLTAARVVLLVSDGDADLAPEDRRALGQRFTATQAQLVWLYVRGDREPSIVDAKVDSASLLMHRQFAELGMPYRAFEANSVEGVEAAVVEIGRLTSLATRYEVLLPRQPLAGGLQALALGLIVLMLAVRRMEVLAWGR